MSFSCGGVPIAGNHLTTELVLATGAVDMMVVDYQCIMPSLGTVAACYHTKMVSTSDKARFPGMEHQEFHPENAAVKAQALVKDAIANFDRRGEVFIPVEPVECMGGFSVEAIVGALGGTPKPLIDAIAAGKIRGAVGIVGCNNPRIKQDFGHVTLTERLIANDILVVDTGCASVAKAKAGFKQAQALEKRARASGDLRGVGRATGAARGQLRGQRADTGSGFGLGQCPRRGHQRPADRRRRP